MKKLNVARALSEFLAISTIAISFAQGGTIIGGNIYLGLPNNSSQSQSSISMSSVTIYQSPYANVSTGCGYNPWQPYQSIVVNYPIGKICYYYLSCSTFSVPPQQYTIPQNVQEVSITVIPYDSSTGIIANFSGSILSGQTLNLYVAPIYKGVFHDDSVIEQIEYGETVYGYKPYINTNPVNSEYNFFIPFAAYYLSNNPSCTSIYYDYSAYNSDSTIQNVTVELSNGTVLIGSDSNGNYYVSSLASSSITFPDGGSKILIVDPEFEPPLNTMYYSSIGSSFIGNNDLAPYVPYYVPMQPQQSTTIPLPIFWQKACVTPYQNGYCYAKVPNSNISPEVIISYY